MRGLKGMRGVFSGIVALGLLVVTMVHQAQYEVLGVKTAEEAVKGTGFG